MSGKIRQKNNAKAVGEKHACVQWVEWATVEVNGTKENTDINTILQKWQAYKTKSTGIWQDSRTFLYCYANE